MIPAGNPPPSGQYRWLPVVRIGKAVFGIGMLAAILWWSLGRGFLLAGVGWREFAAATLCTLASVLLNSEALLVSLASLNLPILRRDAIWLTAVGGLGNSLGGLPLGTGVKFGLLIGKYGVPLTSVFWTYFFYSLINAAWMMLYGAAISRFVGASPLLTLFLVLPFVLLLGCVALLRGGYLAAWPVPAALASLVRSPLLPRGAGISAANAAAMLGCFAFLLFPRGNTQEAAGAMLSVAIAVPAGFLAGLPSLGGIQELLLGATGTLFHFSMAHGIQLGLIARATSLVAAAIVIFASLCVSWRRQ